MAVAVANLEEQWKMESIMKTFDELLSLEENAQEGNAKPIICSQCYEVIQNKFYVNVGGKDFHTNCLHCDTCWKVLGNDSSCYNRSGMVFCKDCYTSLAPQKPCYGCKAVIMNSELVIKCHDAVFHWNCFCCGVCHNRIAKDQKFRLIDGVLYCEKDFLQVTDGIHATEKGIWEIIENSYLPYLFCGLQATIPQSCQLEQSNVQAFQNQRINSRNTNYLEFETLHFGYSVQDAVLNFNASQKQGSLASPITMKTSMKTRPATTKNCKRKRARTTFRQDQLKEMKDVFESNPNPDTAELHKLARKLNLPKRVLQVWFQNARAKQRRCISLRSEHYKM